jgi:YHS domain-containing protein
MRRAARIDTNQPEIVKALRKAGASVLITAQLKNCFDILVGYNGINYIMEIKDGKKPLSQRKLTEGEFKFKESWKGGTYYIVNSIDEAFKIIKITEL